MTATAKKKLVAQRRKQINDAINAQTELPEELRQIAVDTFNSEIPDEMLLDDTRFRDLLGAADETSVVFRGDTNEMLGKVLPMLFAWLATQETPADAISNLTPRIQHAIEIGVADAGRLGAVVAAIALAAALTVPVELAEEHGPSEFIDRVMNTYLEKVKGDAWLEKRQEYEMLRFAREMKDRLADENLADSDQ